MAGPFLALVGLFVGALSTAAVLLGGTVASLSLGPIGPANPSGPMAAPATVSSAPVLTSASQAAAENAAAACPGLDWTLLAGAVLIDPALAASLTSVATALCTSPDRPATLVALLPGPTEGQVALVLAQALAANPALNGEAATAIAFAAINLGVPYRWGGTGPGGFDCSGLTLEAYRAAGVTIPRVAQDQFDAGPQLPPGAALQPGDLVFFGPGPHGIEHVGLYIGAGDMIDAPHTGADVRIESLWRSDLVGATRPAGG